MCVIGDSGLFAPVKKKNEKLANIVMNNIKDALVRGQLKPGDKLPSITDMAAEMNVGVSSVREAIKMLEALCVVETRQGERTVICTELKDDSINPLTFQLLILPKDSEDLIEFREMFESAFTFMAMDNATSEDLENIRLIVEEQVEKTKTQELDILDEMDFHRAVLHSTHNQYIIKIGETMLELLMGTFQEKLTDYKEMSVADSHVTTYEALRDKDKKKLRKILDESFYGWRLKYFSKAR